MDAFFETQTSAQAVGTNWSFSEITVTKPSLQRTFLMWFVSPIANQDILNQNWKNVFRIMGKTLLSANAKIGSPLLLQQFQMSLACLPLPIKQYMSLFGLRTTRRSKSDIKNRKVSFCFLYILHEQRFLSFTSRFVKSRVVAWWCFLWLLSVNICTNLQKRHPLYYVIRGF